MARIKTYVTDDAISKADKLIGSDGDSQGETKNYTIAALAAYFSGGEGAAGASAYQLWLAQGNTGTVADFLNSLIGAPGAQGATGPAGAQGVPGNDGTSIKIIDTVSSCAGMVISGRDIGDMYILGSNDPSCTYGAGNAGDGYVFTEAGTFVNIGPIRGPQGVQGPAGAQGIQGIQGLQGIQGVAGQNGTDAQGFTRVAGVTPVLCNGAGVEYTDFSASDYLVQECEIYEVSLTGGGKLYSFSIQLSVDTNGTTDSQNFFNATNPIHILLKDLDTGSAITLNYRDHKCNVAGSFSQSANTGRTTNSLVASMTGEMKVVPAAPSGVFIFNKVTRFNFALLGTISEPALPTADYGDAFSTPDMAKGNNLTLKAEGTFVTS